MQTAHYGVSAYARIGTETAVVGASPHQLIIMLFEGLRKTIADAKHHMQEGAVAAKGAAISKAITIIDEGLKASLNPEAGGEIAAHLAALYDYMTVRLVRANFENNVALLDEVARLVAELHESWVAIKPGAEPVAAVSEEAPRR
jgi:flagellar protein FliS